MATGLAAEVGFVIAPLMDEVALAVGLSDDVGLRFLESVSGFAATVRREVLARMVATERTTREELAAALAEDDAVPVADARRLEIALHHNHLPRLADEQYVEYDPRTGEVVRWKDPQAIEAAVEPS